MRGAKESGNNVTKINVASKTMLAIFAVNMASSALTKTIWQKFYRQ